VLGVTLTDATGTSVTVTVPVPLRPSLVAVIVAVPTPWAVTRPVVLTLATPAALVVHVTDRPVRTFPAASRNVVVNCPVCPTVRLRVLGVTLTDATGASVTVTLAVPLCPSHVAVIVADPAPCAPTSPAGLTVATPAAFVTHVTTRPLSGLPAASLGVAVSCPVCPPVRLNVLGVTPTDATGTSVTVTVADPLRPSLVAVIVAVPAP